MRDGNWAGAVLAALLWGAAVPGAAAQDRPRAEPEGDGKRPASGGEPRSPAGTIRLLRKVTVAPESEGGGARPEVVATAERVFVVYLGDVATGARGATFRVKIFSRDLSKLITARTLVTSTRARGKPTDIRIASDGKHLYAFYETVIRSEGCSLWGSKYTLDDRFERVARVGPIARGKLWTQAGEGDELLNDPIPVVGPDSVFVVTRLKANSTAKKERTVYRVRQFPRDLAKQQRQFDLDLSAVADGSPRQASALYCRGRFYMVLPTTSEEGSFPIDMATPSDLLMVELGRKWEIVDSKLISVTPGDVETFVTGFREHGGRFFLTYKQGSPRAGFSSPLKIYDEDFHLLRSETVRVAAGRGESLKSSLAVTDRHIYVAYGVGAGPPPPFAAGRRRDRPRDRQLREAVVYVYERMAGGGEPSDRTARRG